MRLPKRTFVIGLAMIAPLTMTASIASGPDVPRWQSSVSSNASERTIEGVWKTAVAQRNCQTDAVGPFGIRGLFTFHEGGTMSEFGVAPGSSPAQRSPGHGVWQQEHGWQDYSLAFTYYRYDVSGAFVGSQKVSATLELGASGDEFTGKSSVEVFDANDNLTATVCAASVGTRFE
jgi:hypothetical protein